MFPQQNQQNRQRSPNRFVLEEPLQFRPIIEGDDIKEPPTFVPKSASKRSTGSSELTALPPPPASGQGGHRDHHQRSIVNLPGEELQRSKQSLKGSRVSFERKTADSSDEDSFEDKRAGYQQQKTVSVDHKGILKVTISLQIYHMY